MDEHLDEYLQEIAQKTAETIRFLQGWGFTEKQALIEGWRIICDLVKDYQDHGLIKNGYLPGRIDDSSRAFSFCMKKLGKEHDPI